MNSPGIASRLAVARTPNVVCGLSISLRSFARLLIPSYFELEKHKPNSQTDFCHVGSRSPITRATISIPPATTSPLPMSSSYVATVPSSEPRQPSPQYSATRTHWAPEDMAQSSHAYRYATTDAHHSYNYTTPPRGLYDVQQASYSRRPQNESLPPPMPMEPQHQEYSISSYPDPNQQFSTGRM